MNDIFHALSDETRRAMLRELAKGERTVGELSAPFPMTLAAASKHIRTLERAGLLRREIRWRTHVCHLEAAPMRQAIDELAFYERFWTTRIDILDKLLREDDAQKAQSPLPRGDKP
jgi:DNA-binding transcriptional ArsR family regulator